MIIKASGNTELHFVKGEGFYVQHGDAHVCAADLEGAEKIFALLSEEEPAAQVNKGDVVNKSDVVREVSRFIEAFDELHSAGIGIVKNILAMKPNRQKIHQLVDQGLDLYDHWRVGVKIEEIPSLKEELTEEEVYHLLDKVF